MRSVGESPDVSVITSLSHSVRSGEISANVSQFISSYTLISSYPTSVQNSTMKDHESRDSNDSQRISLFYCYRFLYALIRKRKVKWMLNLAGCWPSG